jgi:hypothetical protein
MKRRALHISLIAALALLSVAEAYHVHPDGGARWHFVAVPLTPSSSIPDAPDSDGQHPANDRTACPLHLWASLFSTVSLLFAVLLLPPTAATALHQAASSHSPSWSRLALSIRAPPLVLA